MGVGGRSFDFYSTMQLTEVMTNKLEHPELFATRDQFHGQEAKLKQ